MLWLLVIKSWNFGDVCCQRTILISVSGKMKIQLLSDLNECICNILGSALKLVSTSYSHHGRFEDALSIEEQALEFRRRVLPEDHPDIG
jgi:hypothetical protein